MPQRYKKGVPNWGTPIKKMNADLGNQEQFGISLILSKILSSDDFILLINDL